jgi:flagellar biosynthetic protein FliP
VIALLAQSVLAQAGDAAVASTQALDALNPIGVLEDASRNVPGFEGGLSAALNILVLLTVLTVAPAILILCTSFTRMVVVLGLLRQALGTQSLPPSQVVVGLSVLLTAVSMSGTFERMWSEGLGPYARGEQTDQMVAWDRAKQPLRDFMIAQIEAAGNTPTVLMMLEHRGIDTSEPERLSWDRDVDMLSLVPAFVLSELKVAFLIGFRIYLPFLVIDMVISSLLVSMGMMMLPPVLVSLPFKLLLFVLVDGWTLVVGGLLSGVMAPMGGP